MDRTAVAGEAFVEAASAAVEHKEHLEHIVLAAHNAQVVVDGMEMSRLGRLVEALMETGDKMKGWGRVAYVVGEASALGEVPEAAVGPLGEEAC